MDYRLNRAFIWLVLAGALAATHTNAQPTYARRPAEAAGSQSAGNSQFRVDSTVVLVNVMVTDSRGRVVADLPRESFRIFEGNEEQKVAYFSAEDTPVSIGLVLDFSGSMKDKIGKLRDAVAEFLKTANPEDEFCVIGFRDRPDLPSGFTSAPQDIQNLVSMAESRGETALLDAIGSSVRWMKKARHARKALLIVSDGGDNHSRLRARDIRNLVRESDMEIYAIGIAGEDGLVYGASEESNGAALLDEIAEAGGGRYYEINEARDLPGLAEKIGTQIRHQYVLGYVPSHPARDGRYRRIQLKIVRPSAQPRLSAYWRRGYYAAE